MINIFELRETRKVPFAKELEGFSPLKTFLK